MKSGFAVPDHAAVRGCLRHAGRGEAARNDEPPVEKNLTHGSLKPLGRSKKTVALPTAQTRGAVIKTPTARRAMSWARVMIPRVEIPCIPIGEACPRLRHPLYE